MQITAEGRVIGAPIRLPATSTAGRLPSSRACATRAGPSAQNVGSMSVTTLLMSKCSSPTRTTGVSWSRSPILMSSMGCLLLSMWMGPTLRSCVEGDGQVETNSDQLPVTSSAVGLRIDRQQPGGDRLVPEGDGHGLPEEVDIASDLVGRAHSDGHVRDGRIAEAECQCNGWKGRAVGGSEHRQL